MAWREYEFDVNGLPVHARYRDETVGRVLVPLLSRLAQLRREKGGRVVAFLAAPPATGKSTLCRLLERLSRERSGVDAESARTSPSAVLVLGGACGPASAVTASVEPVETVGIDGFHYPNAYLDAQHALVRGRTVRLRDVKGSPETYDAKRLASALAALVAGGAVTWPTYSRELHDVLDTGRVVDGDIVIVEGNWLLLDEEPWRSMRAHADVTVMVRARPDLLRERLVDRKVLGGSSREEAEAWYEQSDGPNVRRVLEDSVPGDLNLRLTADGDLVAKA